MEVVASVVTPRVEVIAVAAVVVAIAADGAVDASGSLLLDETAKVLTAFKVVKGSCVVSAAPDGYALDRSRDG